MRSTSLHVTVTADTSVLDAAIHRAETALAAHRRENAPGVAALTRGDARGSRVRDETSGAYATPCSNAALARVCEGVARGGHS